MIKKILFLLIFFPTAHAAFCQTLNIPIVLSGSPAGGDLTGNYLNPQIAPGVVDSNKLARMGASDGQVLKLSNGKWKPGVDVTGGGGGGSVTGTGGINYIAKWTGTSAIGNSLMYASSSRIGVNTATPDALMAISVASIGVAAKDSAGLVLENPTAASVGAQQQSPLLRFKSNGWGTTSGTSQAAGWRVYSEPVQGTVPGSILKFEQLFGGSWTANKFNVHTNGVGILTANTTHALEVNGSSRFTGNVRLDANLRDAFDNTLMSQAGGASNRDLTIGNGSYGRIMFHSGEFQWSRAGSFGALGTYAVNMDAGTASAVAAPMRFKGQNAVTSGAGGNIYLIPGAGAGGGAVGKVGINTTTPGLQLHINSGLGESVGIQRWQNDAIDVDMFGVTATPEGSTVGSPGDIAVGTASGVGSMYIKETGTATTTGWAKVTTSQSVSSGTWTPTLTHSTSTATISAATAQLGHYIQIGNQVSVTGSLSITSTSAGSAVLNLSLPIASNFTSVYDCSGAATRTTATTESYIQPFSDANTVDDKIRLTCQVGSEDTSIEFSLTYTIK